eukprot:scaffold126164_cov37-Prasinocladus_malaysianus.AAC.1
MSKWHNVEIKRLPCQRLGNASVVLSFAPRRQKGNKFAIRENEREHKQNKVRTTAYDCVVPISAGAEPRTCGGAALFSDFTTARRQHPALPVIRSNRVRQANSAYGTVYRYCQDFAPISRRHR